MTPDLSIIILNYNTKHITLENIRTLEKNYAREFHSGSYELILADNASPDNSLEDFREYKKHSKIKNFIICDNKANLGFSKGNNLAIKHSSAPCILILNPDTLVPAQTLPVMLDFLNSHPDAGAATCKIITSDGKLDPNCLRGFPTPWNSFCHFSGLSKLFPSNPFFSSYLQSGWRDLDKVQKVDAIEGAFMLIPKKIGDKLGWFDEDYFFYGEDLQLCFDIHKAGLSIYYVPSVSITHIGGASSGIKEKSQNVTTANSETKKFIQKHRFNAMRIFFKKNYSHKYPRFIISLVNMGIGHLYKKASA